MSWSEMYLFCLAVGVLWAGASLLFGGLHLGHGGHHPVGGHHAQGHAGLKGAAQRGGGLGSWLGTLANPSSIAVFLAWFGAVGFLLTKHSGLVFWADAVLAAAVGLGGAACLGAFLRFLQAREGEMDPTDYRMVGVLGRVSSPIRADGVGEVLYVRDGARKQLAARSEDGQALARGEEVVVMRYEKGIAYVRTWDAMTQSATVQAPEPLQKENYDVE